jgi:hypothetical protein
VTPSGSESLLIESVGVAQRSPTAIKLNPFGINTAKYQTDQLVRPANLYN